MFENLAESVSRAMLPLSKGQLNCLPYSRTLLDFFDLRGKTANPLVVRCVIFGCSNPSIEWWTKVPFIEVLKRAVTSPRANGGIVLSIPQEGLEPALEVTVPYRTLGLPHSKESGNKTLGNFEGGRWLGHLVVVCDGTLVDLTIAQINDPTYSIDIFPPFAIIETDENFLAGRQPLTAVCKDGTIITYMAYPDERTYELSESWSSTSFRQQLHAVAQSVLRDFEGKPDEAFHQAEPCSGEPSVTGT